MTYKYSTDSLRDSAVRCDYNAIIALAARVNLDDLEIDKDMEEAYRLDLLQVCD